MPNVKKLSPQEWEMMSENAHRAVFGEIKPKHFDRIDYVLLAVEDGKPVGYVTVRETDHETVYWQFGGAFEWARNSIVTVRAYDVFLDEQKKLGTKRIHTRIENKNYPMLKLALSREWVIMGCGVFRGTVLIDLVKEFYGNESELREHVESVSSNKKTKQGYETSGK